MRSKSLTTFGVMFTLLGSTALAQEPTRASGPYLPDRDLPPAFQNFLPASDAAQERRVSEVEEAKLSILRLNHHLADAIARNKQREIENQRLKLSLQQLQLDRAEALLEAESQKANVLRSGIWPGRTIEVHWENPTPADEEERTWVREAINRTWQSASSLRFTGWDAATPSSHGIRIRIADDGPHCKRLGRHLDGMPDGMVLNFTFHTWCTACQSDRRGAIEKIAVHEFGHALGFAHEQNRTDAPEWCQHERQGTNGDWYITLYDPESIMNYCNPRWNNEGVLSTLDIQAVQTLYGSPTITGDDTDSSNE